MLAACGGGRGVPASPRSPGFVAAPPPRPPSALRASADAEAPAKSHLIATIARKSLGPFAARTAEGGIAAWIAPAERGGGQELVVVALAPDGAPVGTPRLAASVPEEATSLIVRAAGSHGGWLLAWSGLLDRGESLSVLGLTPEGAPRAPPVVLQQTNDHIRWLDIVPTARGASCLWAEETMAGGANVLAAFLDWDGKPGAVPVRVARGVTGWTAVRAGEGIGVALVTADSKRGGPSAGAGSLSWVRMDERGREVSAAAVISARPTVSGDVEVASTGEGAWLLGWTDRTGEDAQVVLAAVDATGHVQGPTPALNAFGGSALVGLVAGAGGSALAWEEPRSAGRPTRTLHMATVSTAGGVSARPASSFDAAAHVRPELVATDSGFALLLLARGCPQQGGRGESCPGAVVPTFVRLNGALQPTQTEPLVVGQDLAPAALAWGLRCAGEGCVALAATNETPTPVFAIDLSARSSPFGSPTSLPPPSEAPRVSAIDTIASGQPYGDVVAARWSDATLVATLTSATDAPHGAAESSARGNLGGAPRDATVAVRLLDDKGGTQARWNALTARALPAGGLALAAAARPEDGAAVAWTARDEGGKQVHVNHIDRRGKRTNEVQLTSAKGDASDVALAWAGDGWLVAWVDTRDGNGEVYASKVDRDLRRVAREERITRSPGDASDVVLAVQGETAWLAWSDPRESPRDGLGDIYVTTLSTHNAKRTGDEVRVLATAQHSRSPCLAPVGDGALLGWIEDGPTGLDAPGAALVAQVDSNGRVVGAPSALRLSSAGKPTAVVVVASGDGARAVIARSAREGIALDGVALGPDGKARTNTWPLVNLEAPTSFDVALALVGDTLFYDDTGGAPDNRRVRRAAVDWKR